MKIITKLFGHVKEVSALLGGLIAFAAVVDPWVTEEFYVLRLKLIIGFLILFILYEISHSTIKYKSKLVAGFIVSFSFVAYAIFTPTFPLNVLNYIPSTYEFNKLKFSHDMNGFDAYKAGIVHFTRMEYAEAEKSFTHAFKTKRLKPYAANRLANTLRVANRTEEAATWYESTIKIAKHAELEQEKKWLLVNSLHDHGWCLRRISQPLFGDKNKKIEWNKYQDRALQSFLNAIEIDNQFSRSWYNAASINLDRNELHEAKRRYTNAYYLNTQYGRAVYNLSIVEIRLGNIKESFKWLERAIHIDGSWMRSAQLDSDFQEIWGLPEFSRLIKDAKLRTGEEK